RTHVDNRGAIIASTDFDITKFARDTYAYAWPRDGALVANALDRAGHEDVTRQFFTFCQQSLVEEGYFLHKYTPYGQPGSSWLPWIDSHGVRTLPVQEDETGLVLWSLWQHYRIHQNLDFVVGLYTALVVPAADWMVSYFDERNGLLMPSWDLWEERWGVHAFTVGSVWGGLDAARNFADLFGDVASYVRYRDAAERLREASDTHLYSAELGRFPRRIAVADDLKPARDIINWVVAHQMPGGLLSEQLHPNTGAPLSVSPLTWSHAEFIVTVDEFCKKAAALRRASPSVTP